LLQLRAGQDAGAAQKVDLRHRHEPVAVDGALAREPLTTSHLDLDGVAADGRRGGRDDDAGAHVVRLVTGDETDRALLVGTDPTARRRCCRRSWRRSSYEHVILHRVTQAVRGPGTLHLTIGLGAARTTS